MTSKSLEEYTMKKTYSSNFLIENDIMFDQEEHTDTQQINKRAKCQDQHMLEPFKKDLVDIILKRKDVEADKTEEKDRLRRERNRINARKTRERKKERASQMQKSLEVLQSEMNLIQIKQMLQQQDSLVNTFPIPTTNLSTSCTSSIPLLFQQVPTAVLQSNFSTFQAAAPDPFFLLAAASEILEETCDPI